MYDATALAPYFPLNMAYRSAAADEIAAHGNLEKHLLGVAVGRGFCSLWLLFHSRGVRRDRFSLKYTGKMCAAPRQQHKHGVSAKTTNTFQIIIHNQILMISARCTRSRKNIKTREFFLKRGMTDNIQKFAHSYYCLTFL